MPLPGVIVINSPFFCELDGNILNRIPIKTSSDCHLLSEHIGKDTSDDEDNGEEEEDDEVGEDKAFDLLPGGEASKAGEEGEHCGDDEDDVGGVHVQPAPQQLVEESLVLESPDGKRKEDDASNDAEHA